MVDINGWFDQMAASPPSIFGITLTPRFLGGLFSLDGVHPSNIAHVAIANFFIDKINSHFSFNIPHVSFRDFLAILFTDPFVDKDGDGRVTGRIGAGLLETLGPFLGISGDSNDFVPDDFSPESGAGGGEQFIRRYQSLQGKDARAAQEWSREDIVEAFKTILALRVIKRLSNR